MQNGYTGQVLHAMEEMGLNSSAMGAVNLHLNLDIRRTGTPTLLSRSNLFQAE